MTGRPREFDVHEALDKAVELFWRQGYEATSLSALLSHMGISRQSLYNTYGDKHSLFLAALDRYRATRAAPTFDALNGAQASLPELRKLVQSMPAWLSGGERRACLLVNCTMELAMVDEEVASRAKSHQLMVERRFANALKNAQSKGELDSGLDHVALSRHFTASVFGMNVMAKAGASRRSLSDAAQVALSVLS